MIYRASADFPEADALNNYAHVVAEVYCRELARWVVFDADANAHYLLDGRPAGSLDLHRAWHERRGQGIQQVLDKPLFVMPEPHGGLTADAIRRIFRDFTRHQALDYYHHVTVRLPGSLLQSFKRAPFRAVWFTGRVALKLALGGRGLNLDPYTFTADPRDYDWPIDRTTMTARMEGDRPTARIEIRLAHTMPFFDHFEMSVNKGAFEPLESGRAVLDLSPGVTRIRARALDSFGRPGHGTELKIRRTDTYEATGSQASPRNTPSNAAGGSSCVG